MHMKCKSSSIAGLLFANNTIWVSSQLCAYINKSSRLRTNHFLLILKLVLTSILYYNLLRSLPCADIYSNTFCRKPGTVCIDCIYCSLFEFQFNI